MVARAIKNRFLEEIIGAPKRFKNADEAMTALMDAYEGKGKSDLEETGNGVHSS